jgi:chaperonin GroEL
VAMLRAIDAVDGVKGDTHDIQVGINIVRRALEEPTRQLVNNSGEEGSVIVRELLTTNGNTGFNAATGETEDLVKAGVIDPAKVTKTALLNAASIAGLMLTTEALVSEIKEEKEREPAMPPGGGMGGMY